MYNTYIYYTYILLNTLKKTFRSTSSVLEDLNEYSLADFVTCSLDSGELLLEQLKIRRCMWYWFCIDGPLPLSSNSVSVF